MQIRRILLKNLHSIREEVEIDFSVSPLAESGLFAITGDTGAGKTTILDAITLALYGKICRNANEYEALSYGAEEGMAECEFEAKNRRFLAQWSIRQRKSKKENNFRIDCSVAEWDAASTEFKIVAERKKTEVYSFIEEVTGLDFPRFTRSVLLAQGDFAAFLKAAPKERSELLERITGTEIYTQLSKAALERYNLEKKKLDELRIQMDSLKVFSKEELKELKAVLKQKEKDNQDTRKSLDAAQKSLQWRQEVEKLEQQKAKAAAALASLETEKAAVQTDLARLALHRKTQHLHPALARLGDKETEQAALGKAIAEAEASVETLQAQEAAAKAASDTQKEKLSTLKTGQPAALKLFDEVMSLDHALAGQETVLNKQKKELAEWQAKSQAAETERVKLEGSIAEHQKALETTARWLQENAAWESLPQDLKPILLLRTQLRDNLQSQKLTNQDKSSTEAKLDAARKESADLQARLETEQVALAVSLEKFNREAPPDYAQNRPDLLEKMNRDLQTLGEQYKNFHELNGLSEEYSRTLGEISELEVQLDNLRREELALDKSLLSVLEESEEMEQQLRYKQEIYRQQLQIANYEKDRAELKEGEACPLCQSVHHPFREHFVKPFTDLAKAELDAVEAVYKKQQQLRSQLVKSHYEVASKIQQIDSYESGQMGKLQARLYDYERRIAALFPGIADDDFSRSHGDWLLQKVAGFQEKLTEKKQVRESLVALDRQLAKLEESVRSLESQLKDRQFDVRQFQNNLEERERTLDDLKAVFQKTEAELNGMVSKYGYRFSMDGANGMFQELEAREQDFSNKKSEHARHEQQMELDRQALRRTLQAAQEVAEKCAALTDDISQETTRLETLKAQRLALFGDKNPQAERQALMADIERAEAEFSAAQAHFNQTKEALGLARQSLESRKQRLKEAVEALEEILQNLQPELVKTGLENVEALRMAILPEAKAAGIETKAAEIKERETEGRQQLKSAEAALAVTLKKPLTEQSQEDLQAEINQLETTLEDIQQSTGALRQQLKDDEMRQAETKVLQERMEHQQKESNRWAAIYDLIGSSDGKKFRIFAQGLTLQKLVQLANTHLENLYGRYIIRKRTGEELELDILDTYQADNMRSMHTLSGGESFLVSLALALGLSDLAGRNANIRSLFIDEGFGTLDEQTLDLAITTLENLQARGKTIGIISHVKELKERIATQVRVVKKGGGMSVVEVVG